MHTVTGDPSSVSTTGALPFDVFNGTYLVDKPAGMSSGQVVRSIKRALGGCKIGHAGTLDPFATGLLICMAGSHTRRSREFLETRKHYEGTLALGRTTASMDPETPVLKRLPYEHIDLTDVRRAAETLTGQLVQLTPAYSAVKVKGERLYHKARRGDAVPAIPRVVDVYRFEILTLVDGQCTFTIECSFGTYVRSLGGELGDLLGCGAYLTSLRRNRVGDHDVAAAWPLDRLLAQLEGMSIGG